MGKFRCLCCGYRTLEEEPEEGSFEICPVCYWQEDAVQSDDPDYEGGANDVSLNKARENFKKYSVVDPEFKKYVREPREDEF